MAATVENPTAHSETAYAARSNASAHFVAARAAHSAAADAY